MYTKATPESENGGAQSFRRGGYQIPASYAGNAFAADFAPEKPEEPCDAAEPSQEVPALPCADEHAQGGGLLSKLGSPELDDILLIGLILLLSRERESSTGTLLLLALLLLS